MNQKIKTSAQLKKVIVDTFGCQVNVSMNKRDTPKDVENDFCIVVKISSDHTFNLDYLKSEFPYIKSCGIYKNYTDKICSFLLSDWNTIFLNTDYKKLISKSNEETVNIEVVKPVSNQLLSTKKIQALLLDLENRVPTEAELQLLSTYEGIGGLAKEGVRGLGILSEFYTPDVIVQKMWGLAYKHGFNASGKVLEPSCGVGRFFKYHNPSLIDAYEIDPTSFKIAKLLYPTANIVLGSFETKFFRGNFHSPSVIPSYDLVIGNPPYEQYKSQYSPKEKPATGATTFDQYFITRGLDLLKRNGLMVFIVPSTFMRNELKYNEIKEQINLKADLIEAYRLPNNIFPNTYIGTDILVFKKK